MKFRPKQNNNNLNITLNTSMLPKVRNKGFQVMLELITYIIVQAQNICSSYTLQSASNGSVGKKSTQHAGDRCGFCLHSGRSPEKEMATCSSILAWKISRTEEPGSSWGCSQTRLNTSTYITKINTTKEYTGQSVGRHLEIQRNTCPAFKKTFYMEPISQGNFDTYN